MRSSWIGITCLCFTIGLQVASQLLFKARSVAFMARKEGHDGSFSYLTLAMFDPFIWLAMTCAFVGMVTWLLALARLPLSIAYPIVSITFPIVAMLGVFLWREPIDGVKLIGITLMFSGLLVMSFGVSR